MTSFLPGARRGTWEGLNRASTFRSVTPDGSGHGHPAFTEGTRTSADLSPRHPRGATTMPEGTTLHVGNNGDTHAGDASGSSRMVVRLSRRVVESITFVLFTTLLTIFALIGDDIRILSTTKEFDFLYSVITMFCLVIFTIEIILSCLGKPDYLCGFFFNLDVVSTASLILDIQFLSEPLMAFINDMDGGENQGEASGNSQTGQMRSGRTARVGAKAGRVVRVIKLVRILKLYKAIYAARAAKRAKEDDDDSKADDDWGDMDEEEQRQDTGKASMQESQVGKKLSELTIRRVIVLVLTMLIAVPLLTQENVEEQFSSIYYGGGTVGQSFAAWRNSLLNATADHGLFHLNYQMALLTYASYHNWFKQLSMSSGLFWIGLRTAVAPSSSLFQEAVEAARLRTEVVDAWAAREPGEASAFPAHVRPLLSSTWGASCIEENAGRGVAGISLLSNGVSQIVSCPADLRTLEVTCFESSLLPINASVQAEAQSFSFYFCFDRRPLLKAEAGYGLAMTGFVCVVLVASATVFSHDANRIVVSPLEHMIKRVREIAADPLVAMKMADEEFKFEEMKKAKAKRHGSKGAFDAYIKPFFTGRSDGPPEAMETVILEKTIIKLGSLLALGFGQAGANIIGHNIASSHSAGVNVMIPGIRVDCIVGKIRIRDFSTATEVLQAHVMTFVNQIAEIVHGIVDECHGAANKNNGETFLVIWRLSDPSLAAVSRVADLSLLAFAKIHGAVHRSLTLSGYRGHPGLQQRLGANCRVNLSFGLHAGWAIEGAVGTEFKIDASYLSPNVSIASSVEGAASIYGVPILASQAVHDLASKAMADKCRLVDNVIITGSPFPMQLFSLDLDHMSLPVDFARDQNIVWNSRKRFKVRQVLDAEKQRLLSPDFDIAKFFSCQQDLKLMRRPYSQEFLLMFNMGYQNYAQGEWQVARRLLIDTSGKSSYLGFDDGPSRALLRFMETTGYKAPSTWQGVRELPTDRH